MTENFNFEIINGIIVIGTFYPKSEKLEDNIYLSAQRM
jgi:hypothetical protein